MDREGHGHGARHGFQPTHSSSTCFIRRDTLPASLVMRVLHRGAQQRHARISGINPQGGEAAAPTGAMMVDVSWGEN